MCDQCRQERAIIARRNMDKKKIAEDMAKIRERKSQNSENIARAIRNARNPQDKARLREKKSRDNENFARQIESLRKKKESISAEVARIRARIASRH